MYTSITNKTCVYPTCRIMSGLQMSFHSYTVYWLLYVGAVKHMVMLPFVIPCIQTSLCICRYVLHTMLFGASLSEPHHMRSTVKSVFLLA